MNVNNVVTENESWVHNFEAENMRHSMGFRHKGSPALKKFNTATSASKVMLTVFWEVKGGGDTKFRTASTTTVTVSGTVEQWES